MATLPKTTGITYEEWLEMPVVEGREEVVNGEIRKMPPNKMPHPKIVNNLTVAFLRQLDLKAAQFFSSAFGLVISKEPLTCRAPDIAVFNRSTMVEQDGYVHSAPQLAIEVLSPSDKRKEIAERLRDYESIGTPEVWLVSPEASHVEVLLLENGKLQRSAILAEGLLKPKHFPAVQIDIAEIWPD
ncbi:MAG TPA: Uma2 family endonuclease [Bryobacteraceae bacterium]|nr:Uma2 family endonuclease [Bryobacteraceae bacterium]